MVRALGDRSGTVQRYVSVNEVHPTYQPGGVRAAESSYTQSALKKYREQYRRGKEGAWPGLPFLSWYNGQLVVDDGSHRWAAAVLEGATRILCNVDESGNPKKKPKSHLPRRTP